MKDKLEKSVELENGKTVDIYVVRPTNQVSKRAEIYESKVWNEAIQDGVLTKKELEIVMKKRGIWNKDKELEEKEIRNAIARMEKQLYQGGGSSKKKMKLSAGRDLCIQIRRERIKLRNLISEKISLEEKTADEIAQNAKFDFLVANCTFHKNGQKVYKDFEDYQNRSSDRISLEAAALLSKLLYDFDFSFEEEFAENKFLKKFNLVNEDLSLIDPNDPSCLIDTEGRRIDKDGFYIDDNGNRVDKDGTPLNEDGEYDLVVEYENDLISKK